MSEPLILSVVVPARNAASTLGSALSAILASDIPRDTYELIVVDDASSDGSAAVAGRHADTVVRLTGRQAGPAYARNRGAELARGDIVAFVDADVLVRPGTLPRMVATLTDEPLLDAVSASYDDTPAARNFVSQYWNLLLHFGEQRHMGLSSHFASACGAIRRTVLVSAGMYDEWRFGTACLEGIELGQRLRGAGHQVLLSRGLQVTHLKRWTLGSVFREAWDRSALLARSLGYERTRAAVPGDVVFTLSRSLWPAIGLSGTVALSAAFVPHPHWSAKAAVALAVIFLINLPVHRFFARVRGPVFAIAAAPLHLLMQLTSAIALCKGWLMRDAVGDLLPDATTQAYSEVGLEVWPPVPRPL